MPMVEVSLLYDLGLWLVTVLLICVIGGVLVRVEGYWFAAYSCCQKKTVKNSSI